MSSINHIHESTSDPTTSDKSPTLNVHKGDRWHNTSTDDWFVCVNPGAGTWIPVGQSSSANITVGDITGGDASLGIDGQAAASATSAGGAVAITGAVGGSTSGAGGAVSQTGGAGTAGASAGGAASSVAGAGSAGSSTTAGGVGGAASVTAGAGGAKADTGAAAGGAGGASSVVAGAGGSTASSGSDAGGVGGGVSLTAGAGGAASAGSGDGGAGGDVTVTPGAGGSSSGGDAGAPGKAKISGATMHFGNAQTIDMSDAQVALTLVPGTPSGTTLTSNVLYVDANSGATEDLLLPPEADCNGLMLYLYNTGGESIVVKEDGDSTTIATVTTGAVGIFACDGTTWSGGLLS